MFSTISKQDIFAILTVLLITSFITCKDTPSGPESPSQAGKASLTGIVQDTFTQEPIAGAIVRVLKNQRADTTDSFGSFRLNSLVMGVDTIQVVAEGFDTLSIEVNITNESQEVTFSLHASGGVPGYNLYVGNLAGNEVYVVDTYRNAVEDTLLGFENNVWHLAITNDGEKLYVCTREGPVNAPGKVFSVDLKSKLVSLIWSETASDVFVAPDGEVIIISYLPYSEEAYLGKIDPVSDMIAYIDTLDIRDRGYNYQGVVFNVTSPILYAVNSGKRLFAYDYDQKELLRVYDNLVDPINMVISPDQKLIYATAIGDRLVVFDVEHDSVLHVTGANQLGSLALSPNGEYLYITDPGRPLRPGTSSGKLFIFETTSRSYVDEIDVKEVVSLGLTDRIVLMPDGRTAYVSNELNFIFVIDLLAKEILKVIKIQAYGMPIVVGTSMLQINE